MIFEDIIWFDKVVDKIAWKHKIIPAEVEGVLTDRSTKHFFVEKGKIENENLYNALGRTESGRYLSIFYIKKLGNRALIITARDMNKTEKKRYGK